MSGAALTFDEAAHIYRAAGEIIPSVTGILKPLTEAAYVGIPPAVLRHKADIGVAAHRACELYDMDRLDYSTLHEDIEPYLDAYISFRNKTRYTPLAGELRVWSPVYGYAGTLDNLGELRGKPALVDFKCTAQLMPSVGPQTAAYKQAAIDTPGLLPELREIAQNATRWCLQLKPDRTYRLERLDDPADWRTFLACLALQSFKVKHAKHYDK